jgi:hypothetical protein
VCANHSPSSLLVSVEMGRNEQEPTHLRSKLLLSFFFILLPLVHSSISSRSPTPLSAIHPFSTNSQFPIPNYRLPTFNSVSDERIIMFNSVILPFLFHSPPLPITRPHQHRPKCMNRIGMDLPPPPMHTNSQCACGYTSGDPLEPSGSLVGLRNTDAGRSMYLV